MPLHGQITCIGGNGLFTLLFFFAGLMNLEADFGVAVFMIALAISGGYTCRLLFQFHIYLSAEQAVERQAHIERLREAIDVLRANTVDPPADTKH